MHKPFFHSNRGFSLAEMLIYIGILGASTWMIAGILSTVTRTNVEEGIQNNITSQLNFSIQTIQRFVKQSNSIDIPVGTAQKELILRTGKTETDPTSIYLENGKVFIKQGTDSSQPITNSNVHVDSLEFRRFSNPNAKDIVQIDISMSGTELAVGNKITRSLRSAVTRAYAVTFNEDAIFGGDILPDVDGQHNVGLLSQKWASVTANQICIGSDCKTSWPSGSGGSGDISFSGTPSVNYLTKWTDISASPKKIGNSIINEDSANNRIGINATSPQKTLDVVGDIQIKNSADTIMTLSRTSSPYSTLFKVGTNGAFVLSQNGTDIISTKDGWKVGINNSSPAYALDVGGDIKANGGLMLMPELIPPANTNGAIYYDQSLNKFQCYEAGSWKNCINTGGGGGGGWTRDSGTSTLYPTTITDRVSVGTISAITGYAITVQQTNQNGAAIGVRTDSPSSYNALTIGVTPTAGPSGGIGNALFEIGANGRVEIMGGGLLRIGNYSGTPSQTVTVGKADMYVKGNKLIVRFCASSCGNTSNIKYRYMNLSGTDATWNYQTTTEP